MNPHSQPIIDNFHDEWDVQTLGPQTPPRKIMLNKERMKIFQERIQAGHGTHHVHWIVYDEYKPEIHGTNIPDSHMILFTVDPRQHGGILSFDGIDVEWNEIIEKRDGVWGVFEGDWDEEPENEEQGEVPAEQQIYEVLLEGAGGDHEAAWDVYERFRAHQERQRRKERVYQAMLEELGGKEALAREVHALWCQEEEQTEEPEDEREEEREENEQDVLARVRVWAKAFRMGYEHRESSLQKSPPKTTSSVEQDDSDQSTESKQELDVYDCLGEWAEHFDGQQKDEDDHSLGDEAKKIATTEICEDTDRLIDIDQDQAAYDCLDEWAMCLENGTKHASVFDQTSNSVDMKDTSTLIEIDIETPDVYGDLDFWAQQLGHGNNPTKEHLPETVKTTITGTTDCIDIFYDGKVTTKTTTATMPSVQRYADCKSSPSLIARTPDHGIASMRLKTPEDFRNYRHHSQTNFGSERT